MNLFNALWQMASTANNCGHVILHESMKQDCMEYITKAMDEVAAKIGYDGWTYHRPASEYANISIFWNTVREATLKYLNEKHPQAWFKPVFMTVDEQRALGIPV